MRHGPARPFRHRLVARILAIALAAAVPAAIAKKAPPCTTGRFLVQGDSIVTGAAQHDVEPIVLDAGGLAVASACPSTRAKLKRAGD